MTRAEFQAGHGEQWAAITGNPAFFAAMQVVSAEKLQSISKLTDEQIKEHGTAILADFRGHLGVENALIELAVAVSDQTPFDLPAETYGSTTNTETFGPVIESQTPPAFVTFSPARKPKKKAK